MAFFSVAFSAIVLLLITEKTHAKPFSSPIPTSTQAGCNYHGSFYQPGEVIHEDKCSKFVCMDFGGHYGVLVYDKPCVWGPPTGSSTPSPTPSPTLRSTGNWH